MLSRSRLIHGFLCCAADMVKAYEYILQKHNVHVAYLVDGGCDVLLSGDETELGTPVEDMMHLKALSRESVGFSPPPSSIIPQKHTHTPLPPSFPTSYFALPRPLPPPWNRWRWWVR